MNNKETICGIEFEQRTSYCSLGKITNKYNMKLFKNEAGYECHCVDWEIGVSSSGSSKEEVVAATLDKIKELCLSYNKSLLIEINENMDCLNVINKLASS